ncbi:hypothetical protein K4F52_007755 [Lecanicillium sp. MT-2017a]|nr:hypothetical protein K4F52_007755 [Lecanicillium sp. MT-2017a]
MFRATLLFTAALVAQCFTFAAAGQAQFCRDGYTKGEADFCMATFLYHNHTSSSHDLYVTMETRRSRTGKSTASDGWTAIGTGPTMSGALMFIMYGDPESTDRDGPTLSVRTVEQGHEPPQVFDDNQDSQGGVQVRVLNSSWIPSDDYYTGQATLVCYSCGDWEGNAVATKATSQPWIYAFNQNQDLAPYGDDERLNAHTADGWGSFYVDMASATTHHGDVLPAVDRSIMQQGASDKPIEQHQPGLGEKIAARPIAYLHGLFMCLAFLILFPVGVVAIRSGLSKAFRFHWAIQGAAIGCALCGAGMGLAMSEGNIFGPTHQKIGIAVSSLLVLQVVSGWWHHIKFVQIRRRTWVSYAHMSVGWAVLLGGWVNALIGLTLFGLGNFGFFLVAGFIAAEAVALVGWVYIARKRSQQAAVSKDGVWEDAGEEYFALHDDLHSDSEDDEEMAPLKREDERRSDEYKDEVK